MITREQLISIYSMSIRHAEEWLPSVNLTLNRYNINTRREVAAFLSNVLHESAGFNRLVENLNYSAKALARVWPSRYSTNRRSNGRPNQLALSLHRNPEAIANHTYANRMGNGNIASGDGYRYRGHGLIQNTGKNSAIMLNRELGREYDVDFINNYHDLLTQPLYASLAAGVYWSKAVQPILNRNSRVSDLVYLDIACDIVNIGRHTRNIGDAIGFTDRKNIYYKALRVL